MTTIRYKQFPVIRSVALMALPLISCTESQPVEKPNILWITIEDTSPHFLGCYGNDQVKTPNIDQLASDGVLFTSAFANAPVCSAARSTLITGLLNELSGNGNHRSTMPLPETIRGYPTFMRELGYYTTNNSKTDYNTANEEVITQSSWHESSNQAGWWNRDSLQPFFSVFNYMESHQSRTMTNPWNWYQEHVISRLDHNELTDENDIAMPPFYRDSPEMRKHFNRVYNSLNLTDKRIGELLDRLKEDGLMESTIIFLYGDHGQGIPRGKSNSIGFSYRVPFIIWFPEKYKHLSPWGHEAVTDELVSFVDLPPTMLSLTGAPIPEYMTGRPFLGDQRKEVSGYVYGSRNRIDETPGLERIVTDGRYIYTRVFLPQFPAVRYQKYNDVGDIAKTIRRDHDLGLLNPTQQEMLLSRESEYLYDLHNDPWEVNNLIGLPEYEDKVSVFRNALKRHNLQSKDVHFLPEYEIAHILVHTTPYDYRLESPEIIVAAIEAAWKATDRNANPAWLLEMMKHNEPLIRYWAATGLTINKQKLADQVDVLFDFIDDDYPPVQIQIAGLAYELTQEDRAKKVLEQHIFSDNLYQSLQALQLVLYMENGLRKDFVPAVNRLIYSLPDRNLSNTLDVMSTSELILYLEEGRLLYYDFMLRWMD